MDDENETRSIRRRRVNKIVEVAGFVVLVALVVYGFCDFFFYNQEDDNASTLRYAINTSIKISFFCVIPCIALFGMLMNRCIVFHPKLSSQVFTKPSGLLVPNILPLSYYWLMSLFKIVSSIAVLSDEILQARAWAFTLFHLILFHFLGFIFLMYFVLIQHIQGSFKIAIEKYKIEQEQRRVTPLISTEESLTDVIDIASIPQE